ncbi:TPA: hypothetical protein N0F65_008050, partial [Lagenidium giganteum]
FLLPCDPPLSNVACREQRRNKELVLIAVLKPTVTFAAVETSSLGRPGHSCICGSETIGRLGGQEAGWRGNLALIVIAMGSVSLFRVGDDVELWRVLVNLSILVLFVVVFEQLLHHSERKLKRFPKYQRMLSKVYRELMILGFIGLGIKLVKEASHVDAYSPTMVAFQVADLTIFILALALIVQSMCIFVRLRRRNVRIDRAEMMTATDLADAVDVMQNHTRGSQLPCTRWWCNLWANVTRQPGSRQLTPNECDEMAQMRVLRHLFLCRYKLPQAFPFSKYLRQAQDNQITHMIDVEMSTWVLLLAAAWGIDLSTELLASVNAEEENYALLVIFLIFSWLLTLLHVGVDYYFRFCLRQLLRAAGYTGATDMLSSLRAIAVEEERLIKDEHTIDPIKAMQVVQDKYEARRIKHKQHHHHCIEHDTGLQLLVMAASKVCDFCCRRHARDRDQSTDLPYETPREREGTTTWSSDLDSPSPSVPFTPPPPGHTHHARFERQTSLVQPIQIRYFSRKVCHFGVMFLLMLNGFYTALMLQCIVYQLGYMYEDFGLIPVLAVPLPLLLNVVYFQPRIFRVFVLVSSVFRVDVSTLSEVINHFSEIVDLRSEFCTSLSDCMKAARKTRNDLEEELHVRDPKRTGFVEVEELRSALRCVGFHLSIFRFNSVAKLVFRLQGAKVEYAQVLRLESLANQSEAVRVIGRASIRGGHLRRSIVLPNTEDIEIALHTSTNSEPTQASDGTHGAKLAKPRSMPLHPTLSDAPHPEPAPSSPHRDRVLQRGGSTRALVSLYHND